MNHQRNIAVIGLGYVGLPVAVAFGQHERVIAFDKNSHRIAELKMGYDRNHELDNSILATANLQLTAHPSDLYPADFFIIAVPTPVDEHKNPDLSPILKASKTVGNFLKKGDIVVYESTVYPGATEEMCVPVLERQSGLHCGTDFTVGYSPERINPGDTAHSFSTITKVVSGQDARTLDIVASVYESVVSAGVHRAPNIQVAEAAKVLENIQRDVNISLMNEVAMIFNRMGLDTHDVLSAAKTKWNFLPFTPGLVGGHCIGVDPYYLAHKAQSLGYASQVITAARRINDGMGEFVAQCVLTHLSRLGCLIPESTVTVLGLAFKENVSDLRNTRVVDIVRLLKQQGIAVQIHDPLVDAREALQEHGLSLSSEIQLQKSQCVILATPHHYYTQRGWDWLKTLLEDKKGVVIDVKGVLPRDTVPENIHLWRL